MNQLNQINNRLNQCDTRRVDSVEYCSMSIHSDNRVHFTLIKLQNDDSVKIMLSIFCKYSSKRLIELDATLLRYVHVIQKSLIRSMTRKEIRAYMYEFDEEISLTHPRSCLCLIMLLQLLLLFYYFVEFMLLKVV